VGIIIRVLYNNREWKSPCSHPGTDTLCQKCFAKDSLDIKSPSRDDEVCSGLCWERDICANHEWGCTPKGRKFGYRAQKGIKAFFVFQQPDHKYTLWGATKVDRVNVAPKRELKDHEIGYYFWITFAPFDALPRDKWVRNLKDVDLVDQKWMQGRHRFITSEKETELEKRIEGTKWKERFSDPGVPLPQRENMRVAVTFAPNIYRSLVEVAKAEGRQIEEIVKEAIAEWLRARGRVTSSDG
jgi:hypothetical protein